MLHFSCRLQLLVNIFHTSHKHKLVPSCLSADYISEKWNLNIGMVKWSLCFSQCSQSQDHQRDARVCRTSVCLLTLTFLVHSVGGPPMYEWNKEQKQQSIYLKPFL